MASPKAAGKFVGAIPMSAPSYRGSGYYFTIDEQLKLVSEEILSNTGCLEAASHLDCLRGIDAATLIEAGSNIVIGENGHGLIIDGTYLTSERLDLSPGTKAPYRLMLGLPENDGDPFITFTPNITADDLEEWLADQALPVPPPHLFPLDESLHNETLAVYRVGGRIRTDQWFRCNSQATAYAALENEVFDEIYYFEFGRTFQTPDWPRNDFCEPPRRPGFPDGDPNAEIGYSKCHSGQLLLVFGNVKFFGLSYRGEGDEEFEKQILDTWAAFVWGRTPNTFSNWKPAVKGNFQVADLDWPKWEMIGLRDLDECAFLGEPLDYLV
jgi:carboxylesterase type B